MKFRRDREWDYISHVCKYCRRRFYNGRDRYLLHLRHHERWIHPYWYVYKPNQKRKPKTFWSPRTQGSLADVLQNARSIVPSKPNSMTANSIVATVPSTMTHIKGRHITNDPRLDRMKLRDYLTLTRHSNLKGPQVKPSFYCKHCTESFTTGQQRNLHQRRHHDEQTLLHWCQYCNKCFSTAIRKKEHVESHTEQNPYRCKYCSQSFISAELKTAHERIHLRPYQCKFCNETFPTAREKMEHQRVHSKQLQYKCQYCIKPFSRPSDKTKHEKTYHSKAIAAQHHQQVNMGSVPIHISNGQGIEETLHQNINKRLSSSSSAQHYIPPPPFPPEMIDPLDTMLSQEAIPQEIPETGNNLNQHGTTSNPMISRMEYEDTIQSAFPQTEEIIPAGSIDPGTLPPGILPPGMDGTKDMVLYHCKFCDTSFFSLDSRNVHQMIHSRPYQCRYCNESFLTASDKMTHQRTHSKDQEYPCKFCKKLFSRVSDKTKHETAYCSVSSCDIKEKEKPYQCMYCDKVFSTSNSRKVHERVHTKEKPYSCKYCSETFGRTRDRNQHEMSHGTSQKAQDTFTSVAVKSDPEEKKEKPNQCMYCDKVFSTPNSCKVHERIHTKEKPYSCRYCSEAFGRTRDRNLHETSHGTSQNAQDTVTSVVVKSDPEEINPVQNAQDTLTSVVVKSDPEEINPVQNAQNTVTSVAVKSDPEEIHPVQKEEPSSNGYQCNVCDKWFSRLASKLAHVKYSHQPIQYFECTYCDKTFSSEYKREKHERKHSREIVTVPISIKQEPM